jgi:hypothetical protein
LFICISPTPLWCLSTISRDHTQSQRLSHPKVRRLSKGQLTKCCRPLASFPARTLGALDKTWTHWDRSAWHYGTLHHHMDTYLWEAWY